jgi:membrane dipeptidase
LGDWYRYDQRFTEGFESMAYTTRFWDGLLNRGYSEDMVAKIMGGNLMRVFREIWGE